MQAYVRMAQDEFVSHEDQGGPALQSNPVSLAALAGLDFPAGLFDFVFDPLEC